MVMRPRGRLAIDLVFILKLELDDSLTLSRIDEALF